VTAYSLPVSRRTSFDKDELVAKLERTGIAFAPIGRPEDLFDDPHLLAGERLAPVTLPNGTQTRLPTLPLELSLSSASDDGHLARAGEHTESVLRELGVDDDQIRMLAADRIIELAAPHDN
jgi:crotonobetainyl-CoA:carnitine CoA-transferase CaiB-like acyl-CoA transferase